MWVWVGLATLFRSRACCRNNRRNSPPLFAVSVLKVLRQEKGEEYYVRFREIGIWGIGFTGLLLRNVHSVTIMGI